MKSRYADEFNHDPIAGGYDADVADEANPIRTGYNAVLNWVIATASIGPNSRVLELGSGSGQLTSRIRECREIVCVDISRRMEELAAPRIAHLPGRIFLEDDILQVFEHDLGCFDAVISTYTVHHLTEPEKHLLFTKVHAHLNPGGRAVFGDLMLERAETQPSMIADFRKRGEPEAAHAIAEEFFWHLDTAKGKLRDLGFDVTSERFSELSFGLLALKPPASMDNV